MHPGPDEPFVPLTPIVLPPIERAGVNVTVVPQPDNAQPFQPLGSHAPGNDPIEQESDEPRVRVQRDGERVSAIHVQCTCGRSIELACVYGPPPATPPAEPQQS